MGCVLGCDRLLGLAPEAQAQIFDLYQAVLEGSIRQARKEGKYDEGIVDVKGTAITLAQPPQVLLLSHLLHPPPRRGILSLAAPKPSLCSSMTDKTACFAVCLVNSIRLHVVPSACYPHITTCRHSNVPLYTIT